MRSKTFVYYDPHLDMICIRGEYSSIYFGEQYFDSGAVCSWSALWDWDCEKNFVLMGLL